jgi:hypothetical protein
MGVRDWKKPLVMGRRGWKMGRKDRKENWQKRLEVEEESPRLAGKDKRYAG